MSKTKRKYIESHWLIFALQGILGLLFGWYIMFTNVEDIPSMMIIIACVLLGFGIIETFNILHRKRRQHDWGLTLAIAVIEVGIAAALYFTKDHNAVVGLTILAGYTLLRGFFEILIAARGLTDPTDKFIWTVAGMCGIILGFVIFNAGHLSESTFIQIFGTYMMVLGLTNVVYGVHSKNEKIEAKSARCAKSKKKK